MKDGEEEEEEGVTGMMCEREMEGGREGENLERMS